MTSNTTSTPSFLSGYCTRELLPKERPSALEVFAPPFLLAFSIIAGLSMQYISEVRKKKKGHMLIEILREGVEKRDNRGSRILLKDNLFGVLLEDENFLSEFDMEVLNEMKMTVNSMRRLLVITLPAAASLVLSGAATMLQEVILTCLWPKVGRPDINTAIQCFLAPAGLVYALSFGFMFQNAIQKQAGFVKKITNELSLLDQILTMAVKLKLPTKRHVMAMCKAVKAEAISMAIQVQGRKLSTFKNKAPSNIKVLVWTLVDILRDALQTPSYSQNLSTILATKTIDYIIELNNICTDRMGIMHTRIHPVKWAFLEILGVMTLFGVMLVDAQSYVFEATISGLTLYSISMLCYVLADLDSPFNGFFRVDMSVLYDVVKRADNIYYCSKEEIPIDLSYVRV